MRQTFGRRGRNTRRLVDRGVLSVEEDSFMLGVEEDIFDDSFEGL